MAETRRKSDRDFKEGAVRLVRETLPTATAHLDAARDAILAFTSFPRKVWRRIWSSNPPDKGTAEHGDPQEDRRGRHLSRP